MNVLLHAGLAATVGATASVALGQPRTLAEVQASGATALSAQEVKDLVTNANTEFATANGAVRRWTNDADGSFVASRDAGPRGRRSARGTWSVNENGAYCLNFDWGSADTEAWCRMLYKVGDGYYAFGSDAPPETRSGRYVFSK